MMYAGHPEIFIEASDLLAHAVFQLSVIHKMTPLECILQEGTWMLLN
jgi:hypothetical protein